MFILEKIKARFNLNPSFPCIKGGGNKYVCLYSFLRRAIHVFKYNVFILHYTTWYLMEGYKDMSFMLSLHTTCLWWVNPLLRRVHQLHCKLTIPAACWPFIKEGFIPACLLAVLEPQTRCEWAKQAPGQRLHLLPSRKKKTPEAEVSTWEKKGGFVFVWVHLFNGSPH